MLYRYCGWRLRFSWDSTHWSCLFWPVSPSWYCCWCSRKELEFILYKVWWYVYWNDMWLKIIDKYIWHLQEWTWCSTYLLSSKWTSGTQRINAFFSRGRATCFSTFLERGFKTSSYWYHCVCVCVGGFECNMMCLAPHYMWQHTANCSCWYTTGHNTVWRRIWIKAFN